MSSGRLRLFFALWPDADEAAATHEAARTLCSRGRGRLVSAEGLHVTLRFLGSRSPEELARIQAAAAGVTGRPFELLLDHSGYWKRARLAWLAPGAVPEALQGLVSSLGEALERIGIEADSRAFFPHVTIARQAPRVASGPLHDRLSWKVDHFRLMRSITRASGAEYSQIARWSLAA